jgi:translation initiation factor 1A
MPGKKKAKGKKKNTEASSRVLETKAVGQDYVKVTRMLGNCRVKANFINGEETLVHIPGKFRKRCWITEGDVLIVCIRSFEEGKTDMAYKYTPAEIRKLQVMGEVPAHFSDRAAVGDDSDDCEWDREEIVVVHERNNHDDMFPSSDDEEEDNAKVDVDDI